MGMHEIRLRRPWNRVSSMDQQPVVVGLPDSLDATDLLMNADHQVRYQRGFNSPTGLTEADAIELCISAWQGRLLSVQVNETRFEPAKALPLVLDLSDILLGFNKVEITLMSESGELPRITGDVVLRIQEHRS